jgi:hypothetical protein
MNPGSPVLIHLAAPSEKLWGILQRIDLAGVFVRGINLSSFDDWVGEVARNEETLGLVTMFLPMRRIERIFVDESVGGVESYCERFERRVGLSIENHLGLSEADLGQVT